MSEQLYNFLFNPNHEMPSMTVVIVLLVIAVLVGVLRSFFENRRK